MYMTAWFWLLRVALIGEDTVDESHNMFKSTGLWLVRRE